MISDIYRLSLLDRRGFMPMIDVWSLSIGELQGLFDDRNSRDKSLWLRYNEVALLVKKQT